MNKKKFKEIIVMLADDIEKDALEKAYCYEVWYKLRDIFSEAPYNFSYNYNLNITTKEKMAEHKIKYAMHIEFMKVIRESFEERMK